MSDTTAPGGSVKTYWSEVRAARLLQSPTPGQPEVRLRYEPALEGLRTLLLFSVIFAHGKDFLQEIPWFPFSGFGSLSMFYVLTGFLITALILRSLEDTGTIEYRSFMKRRVVRLGTPLLLFAIVQFLIGWAQGQPLTTRPGSRTVGLTENALTLVTFTYNFIPTFGYNQRYESVQMWSLAVDMQVYVVLPLLLLYLLRRTLRLSTLIWIMVGLFAVFQTLRFTEFYYFYDPRAYDYTWAGKIAVAGAYQRPETNLDTFMLGVILCMLWKCRLLPMRLFEKLWIPSLILFILSLMFTTIISYYAYGFGFGFTGLLSFVLIGECLRAESPLRRFFSAYPMRLIGRISYTCYIWHLLVFINVRRWFADSLAPVPLIATAWVSLLIVSYLAWWVAERPLLRLPPVRAPLPEPEVQ